MCGFAGFIDSNKLLNNRNEVLRNASSFISRRGPDAESTWSEGDVFLAHRRLAIVDLTPGGLQPMVSSNQRFVLVFNGEIYNHDELKKAPLLSGIEWRGHSDTEVLLEHMGAYGVIETLAKARGMFAFGLWDRQEKELTLGRDRFGEKPLFYGWADGVFVFGSELKILKAFPGKRVVDQGAVAQYLKYGYIPAPLTVFERFSKVMPGTCLTFTADHLSQASRPATQNFWNCDEVKSAARTKHSGTFNDSVEELDAALKVSVREQLMADVPVGVFLSGGIDSSLVAAIAQSVSNTPVKTFTIGFEDPKFDEAPFAKAIANHLGTEHRELYINEQSLMTLVDEIADVYDEPFADSSQLPTLLVSKMVREHVTVCLSGDGGDELFRGYERYIKGKKAWNVLNKVPVRLRTAAAALLHQVPAGPLDTLLGPLKSKGITATRIHKACNFVAAQTSGEFYDGLASLPGGANLLTAQYKAAKAKISEQYAESFTDYATRWDCRYYMPDDILVKVDRAAMHESLETRVPMLRPEIAELAWGLSEEEHIKDGKGKQLLRSVLNKYVPNELFDRPKQGFGIPLETWLRGPLKSWAEQNIQTLHRYRLDCVDLNALDAMWAAHQAGKANWSSALWAAAMLGAFLAKTC